MPTKYTIGQFMDGNGKPMQFILTNSPSMSPEDRAALFQCLDEKFGDYLVDRAPDIPGQTRGAYIPFEDYKLCAPTLNAMPQRQNRASMQSALTQTPAVVAQQRNALLQTTRPIAPGECKNCGGALCFTCNGGKTCLKCGTVQ